MQVEMKSLVFLLLALGCTGLPVHNSELRSLSSRGLAAALAEVNSAYAAGRLYRVTRGSVSKVIPVGRETVDLLMKFGIKETECAKDSENDPRTCAFRPGFYVPSFSCSSRVRITTSLAQVISLRCGRDGSSTSSRSSRSSKSSKSSKRSKSSSSSSSSESSSKEVLSRERSHFFVPFASRATTPSVHTPPSYSHRGWTEDVQPRDNTFSNYLV